jgi:hypothetical protein
MEIDWKLLPTSFFKAAPDSLLHPDCNRSFTRTLFWSGLLSFPGHPSALRLADVNVSERLHQSKDIQQPQNNGYHYHSVQD